MLEISYRLRKRRKPIYPDSAKSLIDGTRPTRSQFTGFDFTGVLKNAGVRISMDGRGRCMDNIFIERLWRSLKYEAVYLHEPTDGFAAERVIGEWIDFYNTELPHSSLGGQTPAEAYGAGQPVDMMDKPHGLPTSPQAQQQQQDVINTILAA